MPKLSFFYITTLSLLFFSCSESFIQTSTGFMSNHSQMTISNYTFTEVFFVNNTFTSSSSSGSGNPILPNQGIDLSLAGDPGSSRSYNFVIDRMFRYRFEYKLEGERRTYENEFELDSFTFNIDYNLILDSTGTIKDKSSVSY